MGSFDWKAVVKSVAPMLGTALVGPFGGLAGAALAKCLGTDDKPIDPTDTAALAAAVQGATPDQLLAIQKADQDFKVTMTTLGFKNTADLEKIAADDRASARAMATANHDNTPRLLVFYSLAVWTVMNGFMFFMAFKGHTIPDTMTPLISRVLGTMDALLGMAFAFFLGTTANSKVKDQMLYNSTPADGSK